MYVNFCYKYSGVYHSQLSSTAYFNLFRRSKLHIKHEKKTPKKTLLFADHIMIDYLSWTLVSLKNISRGFRRFTVKRGPRSKRRTNRGKMSSSRGVSSKLSRRRGIHPFDNNVQLAQANSLSFCESPRSMTYS